MPSRKSKRLQEVKKYQLDDEALQRRHRKMLENLEKDNYQEDPNAELDIPKSMFKYEGVKRLREKKSRFKKSGLAEYFKTRFRKTFDQLVEEDLKKNPDGPNYVTAKAPPSANPGRKLCGVCGFPSKYNCTMCTMKYCCLNCLEIHKETRCLKWVV